MDRILAGADFTETDNEPRLSLELVGAVVTPTDDAISTQEMALREGRVRETQLVEGSCQRSSLSFSPATNASSERSFSALRRLKTYLRFTMTQKTLNNLLILHVHKDRTDEISLSEVLNDFVSKGERRSNVFGKS